MLEAKSLLVKEGNRLMYRTSDGTEIKQFRKEWESNEGGCLDVVMKEILLNKELLSNPVLSQDP
jgi:hypothetical protein